MGGAHPNALRGLATGAKGNEREQQVYTPWPILEVPLRLWGQIDLDPCSGPDSLVPAHEAWCGQQVDTGRRGRNGPIIKWTGPGLDRPWRDHAYVNPPFEDLEEWLGKSALEHERGVREQILLLPVRTHRDWWVRHASKIATCIAWLRPFPFHGEKQSFPAPCVLTYTGDAPAAFAALVQDMSTFVGGPLR